jgi:hypothetical protein
LAAGSLGFNQIVLQTGLNRNRVSCGLKYLAEKKIVERATQGQGKRFLYSLSQGWEPYGKKLFERHNKKRMRRGRLAREIEKHSVHFGLSGQVTWEELDQLRKYDGPLEAPLGLLLRWGSSVKQRPELARVSPPQLKAKIKRQEGIVRQDWKRQGILTAENLGTGWQEKEIKRFIRRNSMGGSWENPIIGNRKR